MSAQLLVSTYRLGIPWTLCCTTGVPCLLSISCTFIVPEVSPIHPNVDVMNIPQSQLPLWELVYKLQRLFVFTGAGCGGGPFN